MKLVLQRFSDNGNSTQGLMFETGKELLEFINYTLEDESREIKIRGETCIPSGLYEIKFRKILSEKTIDYRKKFNWFNWHLELQNVPNYQYVYIHIGNNEKDTDGCILVQDNANNNQVDNGFNGSSLNAFRRLYDSISDAFLREEKVFIRIRDIKELS